MCRETQHQERKVVSSAQMATGYVRRMVENEVRGWGDQENALQRLATRYRVPFWTLNNIRTGRAKTVDAGVYETIKTAFADHCARQAARLLHEAETAKAVNPDVPLDDIEDQIRALVARLETAKARPQSAAK
jgi:hypothetical protein